MNKDNRISTLKRRDIYSSLHVFFMAMVLNSIRALPLIVCFRLGQALGLLAYILVPYYRKLVQKNLSIAFTDTLSPRAQSRIARQHFSMLGANLLSSIKLPTLSEKALRKVLSIESHALWQEIIDRNHAPGVVVALSHFGNWEMNAQIATFFQSRRAGAIYQRLRNQALDDLINRDRTRGVITFDRKRDLPAAANFLQGGGLVGVLIDQHAGDAGIWLPFFNKLASTSPLAATLAKKTGALLIHATIHTVGPARWALYFNPPTPTENRSTAEITYDLGCQLAEKIQHSPADWFWVHNRWKLPSPSFLLNRAKRGLYVPEGINLQPFKLLVRSPNWLGDACMTVPAIRSLKKGRPDLHLTILTPQKLSALWSSFPEIDDVIEIPVKASPWHVARLLRSKADRAGQPSFDAALLLPNSIRSALEVWLAKIPRRIGRAEKKGFWRKWFINQPFPKTKTTSPLHQADEYRAIVHWLGI